MMRTARYPTSTSSQPPTRHACPTFPLHPPGAPTKGASPCQRPSSSSCSSFSSARAAQRFSSTPARSWLGEGEQWTRVRKIRPKARFQVVVNIAGLGEAQYRADEVRGVREFGHV